MTNAEKYGIGCDMEERVNAFDKWAKERYGDYTCHSCFSCMLEWLMEEADSDPLKDEMIIARRNGKSIITLYQLGKYITEQTSKLLRGKPDGSTRFPNEMKYLTAEDRSEKFREYCSEKSSVALMGGGGYLCEDECADCVFKWLEQEAEDDERG